MKKDEIVALLGDNAEAVAGLDNLINSSIESGKNSLAGDIESAKLEGARYKTELETLQAQSEKNAGNNSATKTALETRIEELEQAGELSAQKAKEAQNRIVRSELEAKLNDDFAGVKSLTKELIADGRVHVSDNNEVSLIVDGKSVDWKTGIESLKAEKSDMVKIAQVGGLGKGGGQGVNSAGKVDLVTEMESLSSRKW